MTGTPEAVESMKAGWCSHCARVMCTLAICQRTRHHIFRCLARLSPSISARNSPSTPCDHGCQKGYIYRPRRFCSSSVTLSPLLRRFRLSTLRTLTEGAAGAPALLSIILPKEAATTCRQHSPSVDSDPTRPSSRIIHSCVPLSLLLFTFLSTLFALWCLPFQ